MYYLLIAVVFYYQALLAFVTCEEEDPIYKGRPEDQKWACKYILLHVTENGRGSRHISFLCST